jgi:hypothetical protein
VHLTNPAACVAHFTGRRAGLPTVKYGSHNIIDLSNLRSNIPGFSLVGGKRNLLLKSGFWLR